MSIENQLYPPLRAACLTALREIFSEGRHAEKIVEINLKTQKKWGSRDRRAFAETVYEIVRWYRPLARLAGLTGDWREVLSFDGPGYERILDTHLEWKKSPDRFLKEMAAWSRAEKESLPDWLDELGEAQVKDAWGPLLTALNRPAPQVLRVNTLKCDRASLQSQLQREGVITEPMPSTITALRLSERKNVFTTEAFKKGLFEMQDQGSQQIAPFLQVEPGARVVDACAGAGGKTLHLAALMQNKGRIVALDVHEWKLNELKTRAARAGVSIVETRVIESSKVIKRLSDTADFVLLDVPCSGLGVLRRHPDTKWKLKPAELTELTKLQDEILDRYTKMAKVGGLVVYATCSVLPLENQERVAAFLKRQNGGFQLEDELCVSPFETDSDGFYAARLRRIS